MSTCLAQGERSPGGPRPPPRPFVPGRPLRRPSRVPGGERGLRAAEAEAPPRLGVLTPLARPALQPVARGGAGGARGSGGAEGRPARASGGHAQCGRPVTSRRRASPRRGTRTLTLRPRCWLHPGHRCARGVRARARAAASPGASRAAPARRRAARAARWRTALRSTHVWSLPSL